MSYVWNSLKFLPICLMESYWKTCGFITPWQLRLNAAAVLRRINEWTPCQSSKHQLVWIKMWPCWENAVILKIPNNVKRLSQTCNNRLHKLFVPLSPLRTWHPQLHSLYIQSQAGTQRIHQFNSPFIMSEMYHVHNVIEKVDIIFEMTGWAMLAD